MLRQKGYRLQQEHHGKLQHCCRSGIPDFSFGVAGSISFANANPSIDFKIGVLVKVELPDDTGLNGWLYWYIFEFRGGVGIGYTVLGAGADVTVGAGVDFWAPITCYIGMAIPEQGGLLIVTDTSMDVGVGIHGDVQFCLDPPIIPRKRWNYDIPGLKAEAVWQIFRLRTENFEAVIKEGPKRKS